jgi:3-oxoacyl-[acyl-carrier-protein] synthase II
LPAFGDGCCHPTINLERPDPECRLEGVVAGQSQEMGRVDYILNNSFGMLGINSVVVVKRV